MWDLLHYSLFRQLSGWSATIHEQLVGKVLAFIFMKYKTVSEPEPDIFTHFTLFQKIHNKTQVESVQLGKTLNLRIVLSVVDWLRMILVLSFGLSQAEQK